ncbi:MAG: 3'-5' exonuclease [Patescibacteria group bacterium]
MKETLDKEIALSQAHDHMSKIQDAITEETGRVAKTVSTYRKNGSASDDFVRQKLLQHFSDRQEQLEHLFPNPYFSRCDVVSQDGEKKTLYFSKFSFHEQSLFSWTTPAARLRFLDLGQTSYPTQDQHNWNGTLLRKDQFMIVDGKIVFMTSEATDYGRTLVYQEKLSQKKAGFVLPEIVERMERAQDDVIRAASDGSFLIAGPAGSGKTTLAFHRIAYLAQSPDTASRFAPEKMIVFVQDEGTRAYFSKLLPDLGIHNVHVTTFGVWAIERLGLADYTAVRRPNGVDESIDAYEQHKLIGLRTASDQSVGSDPKKILREVYRSCLSVEETARLENQLKRKELDRFDLSVLLEARLRKGLLTKEEEYFETKKNFEIRRRNRTVPVAYSLIVLDEAQNYLPEQLSVLRTCMSSDTKAMLYVGDLGQQVLIGTLTDWAQAGESIAAERKVVLDKVYRNTKEILNYIASVGFEVSVPEGLREGSLVSEKVFGSVDEQVEYVRAVVRAAEAGTQIGIIGPSQEGLVPFRNLDANHSYLHILTVHEAQGVEFETVILVGFNEDFFAASSDPELTKIKRDLFYVALTRAMDDLHVLHLESNPLLHQS